MWSVLRDEGTSWVVCILYLHDSFPHSSLLFHHTHDFIILASYEQINPHLKANDK